MARPKKSRIICALPRHNSFSPTENSDCKSILLTADEYEVVRLHDLEGFEHSAVAEQMLISRPTVTMLLSSAHKKLADAIVNGKSLQFETGSCEVCEIGAACPKHKKDCCEKKHRCGASCRHSQNRQS